MKTINRLIGNLLYVFYRLLVNIQKYISEVLSKQLISFLFLFSCLMLTFIPTLVMVYCIWYYGFNVVWMIVYVMVQLFCWFFVSLLSSDGSGFKDW